MPQLSLDDDERDALTGHFDGVGVPKLERCKAPPSAGPNRGLPQLHGSAACRSCTADSPWLLQSRRLRRSCDPRTRGASDLGECPGA